MVTGGDREDGKNFHADGSHGRRLWIRQDNKCPSPVVSIAGGMEHWGEHDGADLLAVLIGFGGDESVGERNDLGFYEVSIILEEQGHDLGVGAGTEGDVFILGKTLCHDGLHAVEVAEWRHGSEFAVAKEVAELGFIGEAHVLGVKRLHHTA